jgi:DNA-binding IclR family transcriptional regulator
MDDSSTIWTNSEERPGAQSIERCLRILESIAEQPRSAAALSADLGISRPTVIRIAKVLQAHRYVVQDPTGSYRIGTRPLELAAQWNAQTGLVSVVRPHLAALVDQFRETAYVCVRDGLHSLCVGGLESPRGVRFSLSIGSRTPLHAGGFNKLLLAHSPAEVIATVLAGPLPRFTERTRTDAAALQADLEEIRGQGFADTCGEMDEGVVSIAAPVFDAGGEVIAALGLAGPETRADADARVEIRRRVMDAAHAVSVTLGHSQEGRASAAGR